RNIFSYGTLSTPQVMEVVAGKQFKTAAATLSGYQRFQLKDKLYPGIVGSENCKIKGVVHFDVDQDSLKRINFFEDIIYQTEDVEVQLEDSQRVSATVYVIADDFLNLTDNKD